jgi:hypothetical protein
VLVALVEALTFLDRTGSSEAADTPIEIYCLGSCGKPEGEVLSEEDRHRGLLEWKFGGALCQHLKRRVHILRFPADKIPASLMPYLDLDETRSEALDALMRQARHDASMTNSQIMSATADGKMIESLFLSMPHRTS